MVWHHVAQRAGRLVELATLLDADRLCCRDLHVIDAIAIPDRLEQPIGEAERHDALDRVFAQKVVDAEDLILVQRTQDRGIQFARRSQAVTKWLLDHHAAPELTLAVLVLVLIGELCLAELHPPRCQRTDRRPRDRRSHCPACRALFRPRPGRREASRTARAWSGRPGCKTSSPARLLPHRPRRCGRHRTPLRRCRQSFSSMS